MIDTEKRQNTLAISRDPRERRRRGGRSEVGGGEGREGYCHKQCRGEDSTAMRIRIISNGSRGSATDRLPLGLTRQPGFYSSPAPLCTHRARLLLASLLTYRGPFSICRQSLPRSAIIEAKFISAKADSRADVTRTENPRKSKCYIIYNVIYTIDDGAQRFCTELSVYRSCRKFFSAFSCEQKTYARNKKMSVLVFPQKKKKQIEFG